MIEGLKTKVELAKRGINLHTSCVFCKMAAETHSHLFFDCPFTCNLLRKCVPNGLNYPTGNFEQTLVFASQESNHIIKKFYFLSIQSTGYHLWMKHNKVIFKNIQPNWENSIEQIHFSVRIKSRRWKFKVELPTAISSFFGLRN